MKLKKLVVIGAFIALAVALCATASSLFWVCRKVRAFEAEHGGSVYANLSKAQMDEIIKAKIKEATTNAAPASVSTVAQPSTEPATEKPKGPPPPPKPMVRFAAPGRYLPPGGARAIGVESVNVTNIHAEIRRVVPENVVQLLAREEREYSRYRWGGSADDEETEELSGEIEERDFACVNKPNEKETVAVPVKMNDGGSANGIFLVAVRSADRPRADGWWVEESKQNPNRYRLVCLSDLGLSVRLNGTDSPGVWVTSLMKGTPLDGAKVTVYSKANIKVMEGETDENGWSRLVRVAKGEPFAVVATSADGTDSTFLALRDSMEIDETYSDGCRPEYLADDGVEAFLWTDRGIYRHDEKMGHILPPHGDERHRGLAFVRYIYRPRRPAERRVEVPCKDTRQGWSHTRHSRDKSRGVRPAADSRPRRSRFRGASLELRVLGLCGASFWRPCPRARLRRRSRVRGLLFRAATMEGMVFRELRPRPQAEFPQACQGLARSRRQMRHVRAALGRFGAAKGRSARDSAGNGI